MTFGELSPVRAAVVGGVNMDICGRPDRSLIPRDSNPGRVRLSPGGVGRNIAHNLALMGVETSLITALGGESVNFIEGTYWQKMMVTCLYTIWIVMPFKILILTSALASVNQDYYKAARVDGASSARIFRKITLPMISPTVFYLIITGFIGAFKAYSDEVALFGTNLNAAEMNTIVGYVYDMLYSDSGGFPGYAAAAALLLFGIVFTITYVNLRFSRNKVQYM